MTTPSFATHEVLNQSPPFVDVNLFALDRPWLPVFTAMIPVLCNVTLTLWLDSSNPELLGAGASTGLMLGFLALFAAAHASRKRWMTQS